MSCRATEGVVSNCKLPSFKGTAVHRIITVSARLRRRAGARFVRVRVNIPKLGTTRINISTRVGTLRSNITSVCPGVGNASSMGTRTSHFVGTFVSVSVTPRNYIPMANSVRKACTSFLIYKRYAPRGSAVLFVSPKFPIRGRRVAIVNCECRSFSICRCQNRGLQSVLRRCLSGNGVTTVVCSGPGGPT